jgi:hypothetical protein
MDRSLSVVLEVGGSYWGVFIATRDGRPPNPLPRAALPKEASKSRQWIEGRSKPLNVQRQKRRRITERLASRVKGLTARFDVLLVIPSALRPPVRARAPRTEKQRRRYGFR